MQSLVSEGFDRAWIALHGPGGEDGLMQGALEWLGIPYTGSGVLASALTMDKLKTKRVVVGAGFAAPEYAVLSSPDDLQRALADGRPAADGQTGLAGLERRHHQGEDRAAAARAPCEAAARIDPVVFAERFIAGEEFTVGVLQDRALPSIRIQPATEFYDYEAKYFRNDTQYHCPSGTRCAARSASFRPPRSRLSRDRLLRLGPRRLHARRGDAASSISSRSTRRPA